MRLTLFLFLLRYRSFSVVNLFRSVILRTLILERVLLLQIAIAVGLIMRTAFYRYVFAVCERELPVCSCLRCVLARWPIAGVGAVFARRPPSVCK